MNEYENKIELMNYLNVLWKRKWFIIIATFLFISSTVVINSFLPTKWEVDAIIAPSQFTYRSQEGIFKEKLFVSPSYLATLINRAAYNNLIAAELRLDIKEFPKLRVEILKNTKLIQVSIKEKDREKAKLILNSLFNQLKKIFDQHANKKIKEINSQIKSKETEKSILKGKIDAYKNKLNIIKKRKQEIEEEMSAIRKKTEELKKEQSLILKKKNKSQSESFTLFHYSNEIQQSLMNYIRLNMSVDNKKIEEEIVNLKREDKERLLSQIKNEINDLNETKERIYYAQIPKEPTSSISPVSSKKLTNVLIAGILGLLISGMLAFFLEYIEKQKFKSKT